MIMQCLIEEINLFFLFENSKILWCLNVIAFSNSYMYQVTLSLTWIELFFRKNTFTLH